MEKKKKGRREGGGRERRGARGRGEGRRKRERFLLHRGDPGRRGLPREPDMDRSGCAPACLVLFRLWQNGFMLSRESYGEPWLSPTWTLALEEQFYLVAPFLFLFVRRRWQLALLIGFVSPGSPCELSGSSPGPSALLPLTLLPASADVLCVGLVLAVLVKTDAIPWQRWSMALRIAPIGFLLAAYAAQRLDGGEAGPLVPDPGSVLRRDRRGPVHPHAGEGSARGGALRVARAAVSLATSPTAST